MFLGTNLENIIFINSLDRFFYICSNSCGEYLFVSPMTYLLGKTLEYEFEENEPFINIPRFNDVVT